MCGPAGSGKSTHARALEAQGMIRLSFDEEAWERGFRRHPLDDAVHKEIEDDLRERLVEAVRSGKDVVLDYSFWSRKMRADYRALLRPLGVEPETVYLATPRDVVLARMNAREWDAANEVGLADGVAAQYFDHFEVPTPDEGPLTVID
jgi:hypothetical protein